MQMQVSITQSCPTLCDPTDCVACQAPLSMGFPRQEYRSGCHSLLQSILLTRGLNLGLLHCRQILNCLSLQGSPQRCKPCSKLLKW